MPRTYYIRDAQGHPLGAAEGMATYRYLLEPVPNTNPQEYLPSLKLTDRPIYGSSRVGSHTQEKELYAATVMLHYPYTQPMPAAKKRYELTDHLGNVSTVVSGKLLPMPGGGYQADVVSAQGYEPFGALLPGRNWSSDSYRWGFQGQEKDNEVYGSEGTSYTAEFWQYDTRVARRWNLDPLGQFNSPYLALANNPIIATDPTGAWVPEVTETSTTNKDGSTTKSGFLSARMEDGDNAQSLAKFLSIDIEQATSLFSGMGEAKTLAVPDAIAAPINAAIHEMYNPTGNDYVDDRFIPDVLETNYNCWESALSIAKGQTPDFNNVIPWGGTYAQALRDPSQFENVSGNPDAFVFGRTAIRYAVDHERPLLGNWNQTTHGSVYLGTSKDGTVYVWTKNGQVVAPTIMRQEDVIKMYGKVQGSGPTPNEGGFYNYVGR